MKSVKNMFVQKKKSGDSLTPELPPRPKQRPISGKVIYTISAGNEGDDPKVSRHMVQHEIHTPSPILNDGSLNDMRESGKLDRNRKSMSRSKSMDILPKAQDSFHAMIDIQDQDMSKRSGTKSALKTGLGAKHRRRSSASADDYESIFMNPDLANDLMMSKSSSGESNVNSREDLLSRSSLDIDDYFSPSKNISQVFKKDLDFEYRMNRISEDDPDHFAISNQYVYGNLSLLSLPSSRQILTKSREVGFEAIKKETVVLTVVLNEPQIVHKEPLSEFLSANQPNKERRKSTHLRISDVQDMQASGLMKNHYFTIGKDFTTRLLVSNYKYSFGLVANEHLGPLKDFFMENTDLPTSLHELDVYPNQYKLFDNPFAYGTTLTGEVGVPVLYGNKRNYEPSKDYVALHLTEKDGNFAYRVEVPKADWLKNGPMQPPDATACNFKSLDSICDRISSFKLVEIECKDMTPGIKEMHKAFHIVVPILVSVPAMVSVMSSLQQINHKVELKNSMLAMKATEQDFMSMDLHVGMFLSRSDSNLAKRFETSKNRHYKFTCNSDVCLIGKIYSLFPEVSEYHVNQNGNLSKT